MQERKIEYTHAGVTLEAFMAWDEGISGPRPGVAIAHAWSGRSPFEENKARALAAQGYVGFALDLYGKGVLGSGPEENGPLMQPFLDDRAMLQDRLLTAIGVMRDQAEVDAARTAAIGYCFGGLCVLDVARTGADIGGVASFHGLLGAPGNTAGKAIPAKVLVLHGNDDPMVPVDTVVALQQELTEAGADWQVHTYGNAMHSFTNPDANDRDFGTVYNAKADQRSWQSLISFLGEVFSG
ncbi:MAG: dienelactone hydrolase family protein [Gammaproteobacteria bacterium]|nr:dienelactone hydrolase family protein [Gammaproteobacteria bacterium]NNL99691.1 dienelactone hydrolase family protein [Gammaproteobacteria bacterium]